MPSLTDNPSAERYWTVLPRYIAALENSILLSRNTGGHPAETHRHYWASILFLRLCSTATSLLHLCPQSPTNEAWTHWDFSSLAPLVRCLVRTGVHLFYFGTEEVGEDESRARILLLQMWDAGDRARLFQDLSLDDQQRLDFEAKAAQLFGELQQTPFFANLPPEQQTALIRGEVAQVIDEDQILDRMELFNGKERALLRFVLSHAEGSPLSYYRTGNHNRGTGAENDSDQQNTSTAIDAASDILTNAHKGMQFLFREHLAAVKQARRGISADDHIARAIDFALQFEGGNIDELIAGDASGEPILCSDCFRDEGLRRCASSMGRRDVSECANCHSRLGRKLNRRSVAHLARDFFVLGTVERLDYGAAPLIQFNTRQETSIDVPHWLDEDIRLIGQTLKVGFFRYGPRMWMVGEVQPLNALRERGTRSAVIARLLDEYPGRILGTDECFYRVRKSPTASEDITQYDSPPPDKLGQGRFDTPEIPILYGSQDLDVCLHECRVTADDRLYVASLAPTRPLKLLNLAEPLQEAQVDEFTSLDMAVHMLFLAGSHSYEISRAIAAAAKDRGFDGLVYPSYFSLLRTGATPFETTLGISHRRLPGLREDVRQNTIQNLALFGRPVAAGLVVARSIDRVSLSKVDYTLTFGPVLI